KKGYDDFAQPVQFLPGEPELVMMISLVKSGPEPGEEPAPAVVASRAPRARVAPARKAPTAEDDASPEAAALGAEPFSGSGAKGGPAPAAAGATGKVSVNSIPASSVTLNGRD